MKEIKNRLLAVLVVLVSCIATNAQDFEVQGIYYTITSNSQPFTCAVKAKPYGKYEGVVAIPSSVEYKGNTYSVTAICEKAFFKCELLSSITIPGTVMAVGDFAFSGCTSLDKEDNIRYADTYVIEVDDLKKTEYNIKEGTRFIGNEAFKGCTAMSSIDIPNTVVHFGSSAFDGCTSLTSINIPNSVITLGDKMFSNCRALNSVTLGTSVKAISSNAFFSCAQLKNVDIPNSVTTICDKAFYNCARLEAIELPSSIKTIESSAFESCKALKQITIPESVEIIGDDAFKGCSGFPSEDNIQYADIYLIAVDSKKKNEKQYTIKEGTKFIGSNAFESCKYLESIEIPNSVTNIGTSAFSGCINLSKVEIPSSVTFIGEKVFNSCTKLSAINVDAENTCFSSDKGILFNKNQTSIILYPINSEKARYDIPETVTAIAASTFSGGKNLKAVFIPSSVKIIGDEAFSNCRVLENVIFSSSATVTDIGNRAFSGCSSLKNITIPSSVNNIGTRIFDGCSSIEDIFVEEGSTTYSSVNGILFDAKQEKLIAYPRGKKAKEYVVPKSVITIDEGAFSNNETLTSVTIGKSTKYIRDNAFEGCINFTNIIIPNSVVTIGNNAFSRCSNIDTVTMGSSLQQIGGYAFSSCSEIKDIYLKAMIPPTCGNQVLYNVNQSGITLFVEESVVDTYRDAGFWRDFNIQKCNYIENDEGVVVYDGKSEASSCKDMNEAINLAVSENALFYYPQGKLESLPANFIVDDNARLISLTDAEPFYCPSDVEAEKLTYTRNFKNTSWQALYVPFDMEYSEWADKVKIAYINNVHQYDEDEDGVSDRTVLEFVTKKSGTIKANTPYMIQALDTGEIVFELENKILAATTEDGYVDCRSTTWEYTITGTYQTKTDMYENRSFALSNGTFIQANKTGVTLSPFRIFLDMTARSGNGALRKPQRVEVSVDGETTDIQTVPESTDSKVQTTDCYNLAGQKVNGSYKGLVIKNGRKYINK